MLAKVRPALLEDVPPSFTVTFNPSPSSPVTSTNQFVLTDGTTNFLNRAFIGTDVQEISITLAEGLTFHADPTGDKAIVWTVPPPGAAPVLSFAGNTLSFTVPKPTQALHPWVFRIIIDTPEAKGILSQSIFLAKPLGTPSDSLFLHYDKATGSFVLADNDGSNPPEDGIPLDGHELGLINVEPSGRTLSVQLSTGNDSSIRFAENPVVWSPQGASDSSQGAPGWISASRDGSDPSKLTLSINSPAATLPAAGQSIGLRFALEITTASGTTTVLSPDPILVNATIGDGG